METGFTVLTVLMIFFVILGIFDGFFLHLVRYRLHEHKESRTEHLIHSIRAVIFPLILFSLFLSESLILFYSGLFFVFLDLIILGIDAYAEKDSRSFMGGLPRWEYIIHLFVNGFHFAAISVFLILRLQLTENGVEIMSSFDHVNSYHTFSWLVWNLIPGSVVMALLHVLLNFEKPQMIWRKTLRLFIRKESVLMKQE